MGYISNQHDGWNKWAAEPAVKQPTGVGAKFKHRVSASAAWGGKTTVKACQGLDYVVGIGRHFDPDYLTAKQMSKSWLVPTTSQLDYGVLGPLTDQAITGLARVAKGAGYLAGAAVAAPFSLFAPLCGKRTADGWQSKGWTSKTLIDKVGKDGADVAFATTMLTGQAVSCVALGLLRGTTLLVKGVSATLLGIATGLVGFAYATLMLPFDAISAAMTKRRGEDPPTPPTPPISGEMPLEKEATLTEVDGNLAAQPAT